MINYRGRNFNLDETSQIEKIINRMVNSKEVTANVSRDMHKEWFPPYGPDDFELISTNFRIYIQLDKNEQIHCMSFREVDFLMKAYEKKYNNSD